MRVVTAHQLGAETAVIAYLKPALGPGVTVATRIPRQGTELRFPARMVRVTRAGGTSMSPAHDRPMVLVECWAETGPDAEALTGRVRGLMLALDDTLVGGLYLSHGYEVTGVINYDDPRTENPRYEFMHSLITRARTT